MFVAAGGGAKLSRLLRDEGFPVPQTKTTYMWRARGRIPHKWVPMVVFALLKQDKARLSGLLRKMTGDPADLSRDNGDD